MDNNRMLEEPVSKARGNEAARLSAKASAKAEAYLQYSGTTDNAADGHPFQRPVNSLKE